METISSREALAGHRKSRRYVEAFIEPAGAKFRFRSMSAGEQFKVAERAEKMKVNVRIIAIASCVCDEHGRLIFAWDSKDDCEFLDELDGKIVDALYDVCNEHCANMTPASKLIAAAEKNSQAGADGGGS